MTTQVMAAPGGPGIDPVETRRQNAPLWRRFWRLPLLAHAAALLAVLCALAAWVGPGSSFTSDEGASILQAQAIQRGSWTVPDPMPGVDPAGSHYPLELSARGSKGYAPLGKHLFYGAVLAALGRMLGTAGMVGFSLLGTVLAALLAACLSRRLNPGIERVTLWFVALGTPLFFQSFLVVGQSLAAAAVAASAVLALRYLDGEGYAVLIGGSGCCALACLLRTEALLWCLGLAFAVLLAGIRTGTARRGGAVCCLTLAAGFVARELDVALTRHAIGGAQSVLGASPAGGQGVEGRLHAAYVSLFQAGSDPYGLVGMSILGSLAACAVAVQMLKRGRGSRLGITCVAGALVATWAIRLAVSPDDPAYGLAVAAPILWSGAWLLDRSMVRTAAGFVCTVGPLVFLGLVLATQYSDGGGLQWGGRFFAVALPAFTPVALQALRRLGRLLSGSGTIRLALAGGLLTALVCMGAIGTLRAHHRVAARLSSAIAAAAVPPGDGGRPVVVTSDSALPRLEWQIFDRVRWQVVPLEDMASFAAELRRNGVLHLDLVSSDPAFEAAAFSRSFSPGVPRRVAAVPGWYLIPLSPN